MEVKQGVASKVGKLLEWYAGENPHACPTQTQWTTILSLPEGTPVTLVNFFKLNDKATYKDGTNKERSGREAFDLYAQTSIPTMAKVGGKFLHVGPFVGSFLGEDEDWDLIAIGSYPDTEALYALYSDEDYRGAFPHRSAAVLRQKVIACTG